MSARNRLGADDARPSARFEGCTHRHAGHHNASAISNLSASVSVGEDRRQWPAVRGAQPKPKKMSFTLGLGPILIVGSIV
jgi:hypothetical protein